MPRVGLAAERRRALSQPENGVRFACSDCPIMAPERLHVCHRHKLRIPRCSVKGFVMQIGASAGLSAQWQTLENAAKGNYQDSQDFDAVLKMMNDSTST